MSVDTIPPTTTDGEVTAPADGQVPDVPDVDRETGEPAGDGLPAAEVEDTAPDDQMVAEEGDELPAGFPGGAILISLGDALAIGGGALWLAVGFAGAVLLTATVAGLAVSGRHASKRAHTAKKTAGSRTGGGRTGAAARLSRRAAAAGGGDTGRRGRLGRASNTSGTGKPGGRKSGSGRGLFGRRKGAAGKGSGKDSGGRGWFGKRKNRNSGGKKPHGGGWFGKGGDGTAGKTSKDKNKSKRRGKGRVREHVISDHGLKPRTGDTRRGKNASGSKPATGANPTADEAIRKAEKIRKTTPANDATTPAATTGRKGSDRAYAGLAIGAGPQSAGGSQMGQFPLPAAASEFRSAATQYVPDDMYEFGMHLTQMPAAMNDIAEGLKAMAMRTFAERPVDPRVVEALAALYHAQRATIAAAETIAPTFRKVHEQDIARKEAPRANEREWNVR